MPSGSDESIGWWRRLRVHVAAGTAALVALSVVATLTVASRLLAEHSVDAASDRLTASHAAFRHLVEDRAGDARARVEFITLSPVFRAHLGDPRVRTDRATMQAMAGAYCQQLDAEFLVVLDAEGAPLAIAGRLTPAMQAAARAKAVAAVQGLSTQDLSVLEGGAVLLVAEAARFADEVLGVVVAGYLLDDGLAGELARVTSSDVNFVVDGRVVASSLAPAVQQAVADQVAAWTDRGAGRLSVPTASAPLDFVAAAFPLVPGIEPASGHRLVLLNDWAATESALLALRERFLWSGVAILTAALLGTAALSVRVSRPLRDVARAASELAAGSWTRQVPVRGSGEAAAMAEAFNAMSRHLRGSYERLEQHARALEAEVLARRRTENELVLAKATAEQASAAKSAFLANMSHELRTPLNAIIGYGELLLEDAGQRQDASRSSDLHKIVAAGRHLVSVIKDILDFSKIEAGRMDVDLGAFDLEQVIDDAVATSAPLAVARGNELRVRQVAGLGLMRSDETKVRQILLNLVSNACKFTADGVVTIEGLRRRDAAGVDWVEVSVSDTGIGMSAEQMGRLFREFSQGDESTTRAFGGTGLGLAISQRLSHLLGGDITVESREREGSEFTLRLPAETARLPCPKGSAPEGPDARGPQS